jgi:hypothetical protein
VGSSSASEAILKGNAYRTAEDALLTALSTYLTAIQGVADPSNAATPTMTAAITTFKNAAASYLSTVSKTA